MSEDFAEQCILGLNHVAQQSLRERLRLLPSNHNELLPLHDPTMKPTAATPLCEVPPSLYTNPTLLLDYTTADAVNPPNDWLMTYAANRFQDLHTLYPPNIALDVPPHLLHQPFGSCDVSTQALTLSLASSLPQEPQPLALVNDRHCAIGPLGPFTGYATILQSSKFLKPAQQLLDECCAMVHQKQPGSDSKLAVASSSSRSSLEGVGDGWGLHRGDIQERKAKLLALQGEVCRRYKQYNQQIQMAISSFESVAGLSGAIPFMSSAIKTISRQFRFLKHVITEQVLQISRALGDEISSLPALGSGERGTMSRSKFLEQTLRRQKAEESGLGMMESSQPIWRPQRGLPERAVAVLRAWLFDHFLHPYPTDTDKLMLAQQTGLSRNQVSNWFINARVRVWKPMVEEIHMLETKGSVENDPNSMRPEASQPSSLVNQEHEVQTEQSANFSHLSQVDPPFNSSHCQNADPWSNVKRSTMGACSSGASVSGQFPELAAYQGGIQMGGLGSVSLTLGLRQEDGAWQQRYQQMRPYFGSHMIND